MNLSEFIKNSFLTNQQQQQQLSIELKFIKIYLILITTLIISSIILKILTNFSTTSTNRSITYHQQTNNIIDLYIDFNHYHSHQQHSINFFLSKLTSIIINLQQQQQQQQPLKLVFWCYLNTQLTHFNQWTSQLEKLQSDQSDQRFVHLIDTSSNPNPLLNHLLKIINISPSQHLCLISTADPKLYRAGLQLVKQHPNQPILAYVPPYPDPLPDSINSVDHLFRWEKDDKLLPIHPIPPQEPSSSSDQEPILQEFNPLLLLFKAHAQTSLPLLLIRHYLQPWLFNPSTTINHHHHHQLLLDQTFNQYIDSALAHQLISLSTLNPTHTENYHSHLTIMVNLQPSNTHHHSSTQRLSTDQASLTTTTGSKLEHKSTSTRSSPSNPIQPIHPPCPSQDEPTHSPDSENLLLIKHKHPSSALDFDPLPNHRAIKKNKKSTSLFSPGPRLNPPKNRIGSENSCIRRSNPLKNTHFPARSTSFPTSTLIKLNISQNNHPGSTAHNRLLDFTFRTDENRKVQGLDLVMPHQNRGGQDRSRPYNGRQASLEIRSCLWINCSTGLISNLTTPFVRLTLPTLHPHPPSHSTFPQSSSSSSRKQIHQELSLTNSSLTSQPSSLIFHSPSSSSPLHHPPPFLGAVHLHFNHTILPALFLFSSSSPPSPRHLPSPTIHFVNHQHPHPHSQNLSSSSSSLFSDLDEID